MDTATRHPMIARMIALSVFALALSAVHAQDSLRVQIHGAVMDSSSRKPLFEALVEWYDANGKRQAITQSNSEGNYALFILAGQPAELRVTENGYRPFVIKVPPFKSGESARQVDLLLVPK